jgi:putative phosphoesterase
MMTPIHYNIAGEKEEASMIGIMADSHDNREAIKEAVRIFNQRECQLVIHAGDFVAPFAASELQHLTCPVKAVFGNCDGEKEGLSKTISAFGKIKEAPFCFTHDSLDFLVTHTDFNLDSYVKEGKYDVIIFGHTHRPMINHRGMSLIINPGETGGWVTGEKRIVTFDPKAQEAEVIPLP